MKKIIKLLLISLLLLSLSACKGKNVQEEPIGMANPMVEYNSLAEINEKIGSNIVSPSVMGKSDEKFFVIADTIAEYDFKVNDYAYTIRSANITSEDISGINDENNVFEEYSDGIVYTNDYYLDRYFIDDYQYTIVLKDPNNLDEEVFCDIVSEIEYNTVKRDPLEGRYEDSVSLRAYLDIEVIDDVYYMYVSWSSSANETKNWAMEAKKDGDRLVYEGEMISLYTYDEDGNETVADGATNNIGYFEIKDNQLYWTGAAEENCRTCIFEKVY